MPTGKLGVPEGPACPETGAAPGRTHHVVAPALALSLVILLVPSSIVVAFMTVVGMRPNLFVSGVATVVISCGLTALCTAWWIRQPGSATMSFSELLPLGWVRRRLADRRIRQTADRMDAQGAFSSLTRKDQLDVLKDLNRALETRDPYTRGHSRRVERHCHRIALKMRLSNQDIFDLRLAASLHDVGKIHIPNEVLRKPGPLDEDEWKIMRQHPADGAAMLESIGNDRVTQAVRYHHERLDGSGYPDGLRGEEIPLFARIIGVADTFDAITSDRPYRNKAGRDRAAQVLRDGIGTQFDGHVVNALLDDLPRSRQLASLLSWLALPGLRRLGDHLAVVFNQIGTVSVASAITVSGLAGVVANTTTPKPSLQDDPRTKERVAEREETPNERSSDPIPRKHARSSAGAGLHSEERAGRTEGSGSMPGQSERRRRPGGKLSFESRGQRPQDRSDEVLPSDHASQRSDRAESRGSKKEDQANESASEGSTTATLPEVATMKPSPGAKRNAREKEPSETVDETIEKSPRVKAGETYVILGDTSMEQETPGNADPPGRP